jgi:polypeptide N-acetylgalactosaminyltransferase
LEKKFGDIVKLYRLPKRIGLIAAKNFGAKHATGDVLIFFDGHCEAAQGW